MDEEEIARLHNTALGEALYASTLAQSAFVIAVKALSPEQVVTMIDGMLLVLEKGQSKVGGGPGAVEHARARLEGLLSIYARRQSK